MPKRTFNTLVVLLRMCRLAYGGEALCVLGLARIDVYEVA